MLSVTNADRARWAEHALRAFIEQCGGDDDETAIGDLIGDLLHFARSRGFDPIEIAQHGVGMWSAEERTPEPYANDLATITITQAEQR